MCLTVYGVSQKYETQNCIWITMDYISLYLLNSSLIFIGVIIMITNIWRYAKFLRNSNDVLFGDRRVTAWKITALILLVCFLIGYIVSLVSAEADTVLSLILFGGSIFVSIVITLVFRLVESSRHNALDIAQMLIGVIELRDPNLNGHSRHVQNLCDLIYKHLPQENKTGINETSLSFASLMHDVGKLGIPEDVLNKPGKLTEEEWELMRNHPKYSVEILEHVEAFRRVLPWVLDHHERIDGKGYYRVSGTDVPLASRIIAVADTYSAITMRRTYKEPEPYEHAIEVMKDVSGTQLDAKIVEIFSKIPKEEVLACAPDTIEIHVDEDCESIENKVEA